MARTPFRFSIAALFGLTAFAAVSCAALRYASEFVASAAVVIVPSVPFVAVFAAMGHGATRRLLWASFAIPVWAYWLLAFATPSGDALVVGLLDPVYAMVQRTTPTMNGDPATLYIWFRHDYVVVEDERVSWEEAPNRLKERIAERRPQGLRRLRSYFDPGIAESQMNRVLNARLVRENGKIPPLPLPSSTSLLKPLPPRERFNEVGHCLIALFIGAVSAVLVAIVSGRTARSSASSAVPP